MLYAVLTSTGFQMRGSEAATYKDQDEAMEHMGPGDQLVPMPELADIYEFPADGR